VRAVHIVEGTMAPLPRADIDTDQIMPKQFLTRIERTGFGDFVFYEWRKDADFSLNDQAHADAKILVAGPNFGCGSSREHAAWGLQQYGFDAIIAPSFGDIFTGNCRQIGLLLAQTGIETCRALCDMAVAEPAAVVTLDLAKQTIVTDGLTANFEIGAADRDALLRGLDDVDLLLTHADKVDHYEHRRPDWLPTLRLTNRH
jgi:3-isopropylmalate/(R)-2-methylmalate dehydratase small subunit